MSNYSFPFGSINTDGVEDRPYGTEDFRRYFSAFFTNGVFANPSTNLQVLPNTPNNMTVQVQVGKSFWDGIIQGVKDQPLSLNIDIADGSLNRIDLIVIQFDFSKRDAYPVVKKGVSSLNPTAPQIVRTSVLCELCLAQVSVPAGTTAIKQTNILDTRLNSAVCGMVASVISKVDTSTIFQQYLDWWISQTNTSGYMTVNTSYAALNTTAKKIIDAVNEVKDTLDNLEGTHLDTALTNGKFSGITANHVAAAALSVGKACRMNASGKLEYANAATIAKGFCMALPTASIAANASGKFLLHGYICNSGWNWTPGLPLYLAASDGGMTQTRPQAANNAVQLLGMCVAPTILYFKPEFVQVEVI